MFSVPDPSPSFCPFFPLLRAHVSIFWHGPIPLNMLHSFSTACMKCLCQSHTLFCEGLALISEPWQALRYDLKLFRSLIPGAGTGRELSSFCYTSRVRPEISLHTGSASTVRTQTDLIRGDTPEAQAGAQGTPVHRGGAGAK